MALDVSSIQPTIAHPGEPARHQTSSSLPASAQGKAPPTPIELQSIITDVQKVSAAFNRKLAFSVNEKLGQVVVKVVDSETDKVVREIPATELQHVYERIREVIGLLFDEQA